MQPKYRAWYKNKMWKVETMYVADIDKGFTRIRLSRTNEAGKYVWDFPFGKDLTLMSFVGKDKHGHEIFENDVVSYKYMGSVVRESVIYREERAGFEPFIGVIRSPDWVHVQMDRVEMVGNLFEHTDLFVEAVRKLR